MQDKPSPLTSSDVALAESIVDSPDVLRWVFAATEWDCLDHDCKVWLATIIRTAIQRQNEAQAVALEAAEQRAARAEDRYFSHCQHRSANSMALGDFIKARAPDLWPDYAALSVNYSYYDEAKGEWVNPNYHAQMNVLRYRAEDAEKAATKLRAQLAYAYDLLTEACGDIAAICTMHKAEAKTTHYTAPYVAAINAHDRKDAPHG